MLCLFHHFFGVGGLELRLGALISVDSEEFRGVEVAIHAEASFVFLLGGDIQVRGVC